ncbi:phage portal protein, HK97 family [Luteibacter sp. UNC138MFCol5.1]|uniref:phage portal protein n=1 Tax=Luteibacter sp. UNC138MFCol5.1 TaxID=1502774 RepID=UPI0008AAA890|nr:phage portal protein [Luteibacter sp. UNC138MFCol5.1]SEO63551.1 phage portal protein, HK97 family [Luteibacter sp. UNC138MFCol5.1]
MAEKKPGLVKSALINWLGIPIQLTSSEFWQEWFGTSKSGKSVSAQSAMQLSTVWACVRLVSETVPSLPLKLYRRLPDGSRELARNHELFRVLCQSPNKEMTPFRFMLMLVASLCLRHNAFVEKVRVGRKIVSLVPLLPQCVTVKRLDSGALEYTFSEPGKQPRKIAEDDMMHIRGFGLDGVCGSDPLKYGRDVLGSAMAADEAAGAVFANGMQTSGVLTHEAGTLKPGQREELRKSLNTFAGSKNAGKLMVLEAGLKYQGISMDPEAAQMLETRRFNVEEICRWFKVPPYMVGHTDKQSSWASSVEGMNLLFLVHSLAPMLENIEQEIQRCLLGAANDEYYAEFSVEGLLRADSAGRAQFYIHALQNGWMSRNDVRRLENLPPVPGGDVLTVQSNLIPLDQLGKVPADGARARAALMSWLGQDDNHEKAAKAA